MPWWGWLIAAICTVIAIFWVVAIVIGLKAFRDMTHDWRDDTPFRHGGLR